MKSGDSFLKSPFRAYLYATKPQWLLLGLMYGCMVLGYAFEFSTPYFLKLIVDTVAAAGGSAVSFGDFSVPLIGILIVYVAQELSFRSGHLLETVIVVAATNRIVTRLYETVLHRPLAYFEEHFSGELSRRIDQATMGVRYFTETFPWNLGWPIVGAAVVAVLLSTAHPWLLGTFLLWLTFFLSCSYPLLRWQYRLSQKVADTFGALSGTIVDAFGNISLVHSFAAHDYEHTYYRRFMDPAITADRKDRLLGVLNKFQQGTSVILLGLSLTIVSVMLFVRGEITVGDFIIVAAVLPTFSGVIWRFGEMTLQAIRMYGEFSSALLSLHSDSKPVEGGTQTLTLTKPSIEFHDVSFSYPGSAKNVLQHFSLSVPAGQKIGLVGKSGAGKSTLVKLLLRHYDTTSGSILFGGEPSSRFTLESLRTNIAFVPQDTALFHRTLLENIQYAKPNASRAEVIEASKRAHAHDFIEEYPQTYETRVGERGVKLSGGQRQRIALARAMLKDAPLLVLDEATSSLDSESEEIVQQGLQELFAGRTVLAIAHRLSTLRSMDRIVVIDEGKIIEDGSPQMLLAKKEGAFKTMWGHQKGGFVQSS